MWQNDGSALAEEKLQKQVRFKVDEKLGDDPTLAPGLTLLLVDGAAIEQDDTPDPTPVLIDSP